MSRFTKDPNRPCRVLCREPNYLLYPDGYESDVVIWDDDNYGNGEPNMNEFITAEREPDEVGSWIRGYPVNSPLPLLEKPPSPPPEKNLSKKKMQPSVFQMAIWKSRKAGNGTAHAAGASSSRDALRKRRTPEEEQAFIEELLADDTDRKKASSGTSISTAKSGIEENCLDVTAGSPTTRSQTKRRRQQSELAAAAASAKQDSDDEVVFVEQQKLSPLLAQVVHDESIQALMEPLTNHKIFSGKKIVTEIEKYYENGISLEEAPTEVKNLLLQFYNVVLWKRERDMFEGDCLNGYVCMTTSHMDDRVPWVVRNMQSLEQQIAKVTADEGDDALKVLYVPTALQKFGDGDVMTYSDYHSVATSGGWLTDNAMYRALAVFKLIAHVSSLFFLLIFGVMF